MGIYHNFFKKIELSYKYSEKQYTYKKIEKKAIFFFKKAHINLFLFFNKVKLSQTYN